MLTFRRASMTDAYRLLDWRNDPQTREASLNSDIIGLADHIDWLERTLKQPERQIFIAAYGGEPVGTVRADWSEASIELSWTVAPERRGRGFGRTMVVRFAASIAGPIAAQIRTHNVASQRIALAAGMAHLSTEAGLMHFHRSRQQTGAQQLTDQHKQRATA
jgi:RimJ/RimL family protein N-acetyltransferase